MTPDHAVVIVLLVIGAVCLGLATAQVPSRLNLLAAGLFFWILTVLLQAVPGVK